jgi:hypothetical protein
MRPASCVAQNAALGYHKKRFWNARLAFFNRSKGRDKERVRRNALWMGTTMDEAFRRTRKRHIVFEIVASRSKNVVHKVLETSFYTLERNQICGRLKYCVRLTRL